MNARFNNHIEELIQYIGLTFIEFQNIGAEPVITDSSIIVPPNVRAQLSRSLPSTPVKRAVKPKIISMKAEDLT